MFERFTERARQAVVLAQEEARLLHHQSIATEHLLLGLLKESEGLASNCLRSLGVEYMNVRTAIVKCVGQGDPDLDNKGQMPFTPRAKKVLELSLREALSLGHNYIGTEHVLLGLVRENEGVGSAILRDMGATAEKVRDSLIQVLTDRRKREHSSNPLTTEQELEEVRNKKRVALDQGDFEEAAVLRDRERKLVQLIRHREETEQMQEDLRAVRARNRHKHLNTSRWVMNTTEHPERVHFKLTDKATMCALPLSALTPSDDYMHGHLQACHQCSVMAGILEATGDKPEPVKVTKHPDETGVIRDIAYSAVEECFHVVLRLSPGPFSELTGDGLLCQRVRIVGMPDGNTLQVTMDDE